MLKQLSCTQIKKVAPKVAEKIIKKISDGIKNKKKKNN